MSVAAQNYRGREPLTVKKDCELYRRWDARLIANRIAELHRWRPGSIISRLKAVDLIVGHGETVLRPGCTPVTIMFQPGQAFESLSPSHTLKALSRPAHTG